MLQKKLIDYLPEFMGDIKEVKVIMSVEEEFLNNRNNNLDIALKNVFKDQFINTSTENGVKRYENMLKIISKASESLDVRRFRLFIRFNEKLPYTMPKLKEQLEILCGGADEYTAEIDTVGFNLTVKISLKVKRMIEEVREMLERMVPLNVCIDLDLMYNQHLTVGKFTHKFLRKYTHKGVRDEVLG